MTTRGRSQPSIEERLLDAVRAEVLAVGLARASATSIARRARVARVTLYRRAGGVPRLVLHAVTRETHGVIEAAVADLPGGTGRDRTVELSLRLLRGIAESPFLRSVVTTQASLLEPYLLDHLGTSQRDLIAAVLPEIERGLADGSIAPAEPRILATVLLQALTTFGTAHTIALGELGDDTTARQVRRLVAGYLAEPDDSTDDGSDAAPDVARGAVAHATPDPLAPAAAPPDRTKVSS